MRAVEIIRKDIPSDVVEIHKGEEGGCKICELGDKEVDYSSRTTRDRAEWAPLDPFQGFKLVDPFFCFQLQFGGVPP